MVQVTDSDYIERPDELNAEGQTWAWPTVMVTGHRPQGLTTREAAWGRVGLARVAARLRETYGMCEGISGMALGADTWWAVSVLACGARLAAYVPFEEQADRWPGVDKALWWHLRERASREVVVTHNGYSAGALHARNDAMLDATAAAGGLVVALLKPEASGGTAATVAKARKRGMALLVLDPSKETMTRENW